jgi:hypothetical protein
MAHMTLVVGRQLSTINGPKLKILLKPRKNLARYAYAAERREEENVLKERERDRREEKTTAESEGK